MSVTFSLEKYKILNPPPQKKKSSCLVGEGALARGAGAARGRELLQVQGRAVGSVHGGLTAHSASLAQGLGLR